MLNHLLGRTMLVCASLALLTSVSGARDGTSGFAVVYKFCQLKNCKDGIGTEGGLTADEFGNLYGTTEGGGRYLDGTVYEVTPSGTETVLYSFCKKLAFCADGSTPEAGIVFDKEGNIYGTTKQGGTQGGCGGNGCGVVFKLAPDGTETVLHTFGATGDGQNPYAALILSGSNLYGTTPYGGAYGEGTVFKVTTGGSEKVIYSFCALAGCADGAQPGAADRLLMLNGALYGTTLTGGSYSSGTVFKMTTKGVETVLYSFQGYPDGDLPEAGLIADKSGNLYGTTSGGGAGTAGTGGTVFELAPNGTETLLAVFCQLNNCTDGEVPYAGLVMDRSGSLYGTTTEFGPSGEGGTAFKVAPGGGETTISRILFRRGRLLIRKRR